jgi:hypothetical protein
VNSIFATLTSAFQAIAGYFGWAKQRDAEKNAPDVKAAAVARQEQQQVDQTNKAVAQKDAEQIRKELAE